MSNSLIIMSERRCKFCGVLLDETNQYYEGIKKKPKRLVCKECRSREIAMQRRWKQSFRYRVREGEIIRTIRFPSLVDKMNFIRLRRTMQKISKSVSSYSSSVGKRVDIPVKIKRKKKVVGIMYLPLRCDECGGTIRYDERGFKVCEDCGLFAKYQPYESFDEVEWASQSDEGYELPTYDVIFGTWNSKHLERITRIGVREV